jgi:hypothetical protein
MVWVLFPDTVTSCMLAWDSQRSQYMHGSKALYFKCLQERLCIRFLSRFKLSPC